PGGAGLRPTLGRYSQDGVTPIAHSRDTVGPMAQTVADVALLDSVVMHGKIPPTASLSGVRLGVYRAYFFADLDADTKANVDAALEKLKAAGVTIVEVDMPDLKALNDRVSFPVALYEAYDDLKAYLAKYRTGKTVEQVAAQIASKDVKGTYETLVVPRLTSPAGLGPTTRLPVGISLDGLPDSDERLLAVGLAIEHVLGRTPPPPSR